MSTRPSPLRADLMITTTISIADRYLMRELERDSEVAGRAPDLPPMLDAFVEATRPLVGAREAQFA